MTRLWMVALAALGLAGLVAIGHASPDAADATERSGANGLRGAPLAGAPDVPPPLVPIEAPRKAADRDGTAFSRDVENATRSVDIAVYGASWCPSCSKTRAWLSSRELAYSDFDIDRSEDAKTRAQELNAAGTIPTIDVEGTVVVGFDPNALESAIHKAAIRHVVAARARRAP